MDRRSSRAAAGRFAAVALAWAALTRGEVLGANAAPANARPLLQPLTIALVAREGVTRDFSRALLAGAKRAGLDLSVNVDWFAPASAASSDRGSQLEAVERALAAKPAALALEPVDADTLAKALLAARPSRTPVLAILSNDRSGAGDAVAILRRDDGLAGRMAAEALTKMLRERGVVSILGGAPDVTQGFRAALKRHPSITAAGASGTAKTDGLFCADETATWKALEARRSNPPRGSRPPARMVAYGYSARLLEALRKNDIQALIAPDGAQAGRLAIRTLALYVRRKPISKTLRIPVVALTSARLSDPALRDLVAPP